MRKLVPLFLFACVLSSAACSDDDEDLDSNEEARRAYLGLDESIGKCLTLGFDGFNSAASANISPQTANGDETGTVTITGQVDQGASDNKGMRLYVGMVEYSDGPFEIDGDGHTIEITYDTSTVQNEQPFLSLSLRDIPDGTLTGTLVGIYHMRGAIEGDAHLDLALAGNIQDDGSGTAVREPGTTTVTGTATSGAGTYEVDITL